MGAHQEVKEDHQEMMMIISQETSTSLSEASGATELEEEAEAA